MAIDPMYVSVEEAANFLALKKWAMYQLLDKGEVESRYKGRRRLVVTESLRKYGENLPTEREEPVA